MEACTGGGGDGGGNDENNNSGINDSRLYDEVAAAAALDDHDGSTSCESDEDAEAAGMEFLLDSIAEVGDTLLAANGVGAVCDDIFLPPLPAS